MSGKRVSEGQAVIALCCLLVLPPQSPGFAQTVPTGAPGFAPRANPGPEMPSDLLGAWQVQVDGKAFKLKDSYNIEIKFNGADDGLPEALIAYFAGDARRPSSLCRSQLDLVSSTGGQLVFRETLNYKSGRSVKCPVWGRLVIDKSDGGILLHWLDEGRKPKTRMEATALRLTAVRLKADRECRAVGDGSESGNQVWCRDAEGNWSPK
ncbi:hypothetical protein [Sphingomonas hengshuiensis]|uniref:Uncharacterized protein n=1 Tax=Sphingomonas hengshuiensis TaxID=1609977 RepID=A0A7U4LEF1_9SPHN|nr:hypothetical protein [Sphingomonas hengshuiensis]AJP71330.1 hypothetical protein TS85_05350 [Sphingomonas hengshuiensis]